MAKEKESGKRFDSVFVIDYNVYMKKKCNTFISFFVFVFTIFVFCALTIRYNKKIEYEKNDSVYRMSHYAVELDRLSERREYLMAKKSEGKWQGIRTKGNTEYYSLEQSESELERQRKEREKNNKKLEEEIAKLDNEIEMVKNQREAVLRASDIDDEVKKIDKELREDYLAGTKIMEQREKKIKTLKQEKKTKLMKSGATEFEAKDRILNPKNFKETLSSISPR